MDDETRYGGAIHHVASCGRFGWILLPDGETVFVHERALKHGHRLAPDLQVTFCVVEDERGLQAVDAELIGTSEDFAETALGASAGIG